MNLKRKEIGSVEDADKKRTLKCNVCEKWHTKLLGLKKLGANKISFVCEECTKKIGIK